MRIVSATGATILNALAEARRVLGVPLAGHRAVSHAPTEDGLHRIVLESGDVVEVTVVHGAKSAAHVIVDAAS
jgi:hypothetical protein